MICSLDVIVAVAALKYEVTNDICLGSSMESIFAKICNDRIVDFGIRYFFPVSIFCTSHGAESAATLHGDVSCCRICRRLSVDSLPRSCIAPLAHYRSNIMAVTLIIHPSLHPAGFKTQREEGEVPPYRRNNLPGDTSHPACFSGVAVR